MNLYLNWTYDEHALYAHNNTIAKARLYCMHSHNCKYLRIIRELSQGDTASCATQEATNLDGTAFFGPSCLTSAFANERRSSAKFSQLCVWRHHPYSHKNRTCNCLCTCNAWTDTLAKEGLWLANPSAVSRLPVRPYFLATTIVDSRGTQCFKLVTMPTAKICTRFAQSNVNIAIAKAP